MFECVLEDNSLKILRDGVPGGVKFDNDVNESKTVSLLACSYRVLTVF